MRHIQKTLLLFAIFTFMQAQAQEPAELQVRLKQHISILAADSMQGREAGTTGEKMAAAYIADQMKRIGLSFYPADSQSYKQTFQLNFPVIFKEATLQIGPVALKQYDDFGSTDYATSGSAKGILVTVPANELYSSNLNSESIANYKGNILLIDIAPVGLEWANPKTQLNDLIKIFETAHPAAIVLHNTSRKPYEDYLFGSVFTKPCKFPVVYITRLAYERIRKFNNPECSLTSEVERKISFPKNIVGFIDNNAQKTVVIGAHFDHLGNHIPFASYDEKAVPEIYNGADDNASGVAAMLELARWIKQNKNLKYNYLFVAFSAEEKGLYGSKWFCNSPDINNQNIAYMLNLDMVGRLGWKTDTISLLGVGSSAAWPGLINNTPTDNFGINRISGAPAFSDHAPFLKKQIPVLFFTTGLHPDYHKPTDDVERINFNGMVAIVQYLEKVIENAEKLPQIPFTKINAIQDAKAYTLSF